MQAGGRACALAGSAVREIASVPPATRLPGAPAHVPGLVNLRGQLLTVVDLGACLTGVPVAASDASMVVVEAGDKALGVLVDDVHDVQEVQVVPTNREALSTSAGAEGLVSGLGRLGDEVVLVIDVPALVRQTLA